jgi:hypothetical protein
MLRDKMNGKTKWLMLAGMMLGSFVVPVSAIAAPHFSLNTATGNETVGQEFSVIMGVDSDTEKVVGIDIKATFDSSKLEIVSVEKGSVPAGEAYYQFDFTSGLAQYSNTDGTFAINLSPVTQSIYDGPIAKQELLKIKFRPKATGVATLSYTCTAGSVVESNIIKASTAEDVVDCASNQSGSYTIAEGTGGDNNPAATATPVPAAGAGSTTSELPQTGGLENTIALIVLGISSMMAALYLKKI